MTQSAEKRREAADFLDKMRAGIIRGTFSDDYFDLSKEKRAEFDENLLKLKVRYHNLKKRLDDGGHFKT